MGSAEVAGQLQQAEAEARHERDRLNLIIENVGHPVVVGDANGNLTGYILTKTFTPSENGVSFGRWVKSDGGSDFVAMSALSFGSSITAASQDTPSAAD